MNDEGPWWIITPELHFVDRIGDGVTPHNGEVVARGRKVRVLQQKWEQHFRSEIGMYFDRPFEWRDVPIETDCIGIERA